MKSYEDFLRDKIVVTQPLGYVIDDGDIHPLLLPHQRTMVRWGVHQGRAGYFAAFGLGKTVIQLETVRLVRERVGAMWAHRRVMRHNVVGRLL